jgi:protein-S-isoprenylcysteine O-methyltransferase Ste14
LFLLRRSFRGRAARFAPLALAVRLALPALFLAAVFLPAVFLPPLSAGGLAAFFGAVVAGVWYGGGQGMVASFERTRQADDQIASPPTASFST